MKDVLNVQRSVSDGLMKKGRAFVMFTLVSVCVVWDLREKEQDKAVHVEIRVKHTCRRERDVLFALLSVGGTASLSHRCTSP